MEFLSWDLRRTTSELNQTTLLSDRFAPKLIQGRHAEANSQIDAEAYETKD